VQEPCGSGWSFLWKQKLDAYASFKLFSWPLSRPVSFSPWIFERCPAQRPERTLILARGKAASKKPPRKNHAAQIRAVYVRAPHVETTAAPFARRHSSIERILIAPLMNAMQSQSWPSDSPAESRRYTGRFRSPAEPPMPSFHRRKSNMNPLASWRQAIASTFSNRPQLDRTIKALAKATDLQDVIETRDWADLARRFARTAGLGFRIQNSAADLKLRAERRAGELLADLALNGGDRRSHSLGERMKLDDLGIERNQSARWQREASVPEAVFKRYVAAANAAHQDVTAQGLLRLAKSLAGRAGNANRLPSAAILIAPKSKGLRHKVRRRAAGGLAVGSRSRR
jgi:hypothetical protein